MSEQTGIRILGAHHGSVQSSRDEDVWYAVSLEGPVCTCDGFKFRGRCRHIRELSEALGVEEPIAEPAPGEQAQM